MAGMSDGGAGGIFAQGNIATTMEAIFNARIATFEGQEVARRGTLWGEPGEAIDNLASFSFSMVMLHLMDETKHLSDIRPVEVFIQLLSDEERIAFNATMSFDRYPQCQ